MKRVLRDAIKGGIKQPFLKSTHEHYQEAYAEALDSIVKNLIDPGHYQNKMVILWGCKFDLPVNIAATSDAPAYIEYTVNDGAVYYQGNTDTTGEIYRVYRHSLSIPVSAPQIPVWYIDESDSVDTVILSSKMSAKVHITRKFALKAGNPGSGLFDHIDSDIVYTIFENGPINKTLKGSRIGLRPVWGELPVDGGGTGADTKEAACLNILPSIVGENGNVLKYNNSQYQLVTLKSILDDTSWINIQPTYNNTNGSGVISYKTIGDQVFLYINYNIKAASHAFTGFDLGLVPNSIVPTKTIRIPLTYVTGDVTSSYGSPTKTLVGKEFRDVYLEILPDGKISILFHGPTTDAITPGSELREMVSYYK